MKASRHALILLFVLALLMAAGCGGAPATTAAPTAPPATPTSVEAETDPPQASEEPTQEPAKEPTVEPSEAPQASPEAAAAPDGLDYCLECHTDQQMLIDTAKPEEEVVSENEGEG